MRILPEQVERIGNAALQRAQFDSFEVRSMEMVMTFMNEDSSGRLRQFRVTSLNNVDLVERIESNFRSDFRIGRKLLLPDLYGLLGESVSSVGMDGLRRLIISFSGYFFMIFSNVPKSDFDPLDFNWHIDFDDGLESMSGIQGLSCVISEAREPEFYAR